MIQDKVFPHLAPNAISFNLESLMQAKLLKLNGSDSYQSYAVEINQDGILIVSLYRLEESENINFEILNYNEIQGIRIKKKIPSYHITFQMEDGRNYKFELLRNSTNKFPDQQDDLNDAIKILESKDLHDMDNKLHKANIRQDRFRTFTYVVTLLVFGFSSILIFENFIKRNIFFVFLLVISAFIVHGILFLISSLFIYQLRNKSFLKEYMPIVKAYEENEDAKQLLEALTNMEAEAKTVDANNMYYYSLSTAFLRNDQEKEALACLDKVDLSKGQMRKLVAEQKKIIEEKIQ